MINRRYRKHIRLPSYDYSTPGYYFVTIVTHNRKEIFAGDKKPAVEKTLLGLSERFPSVKLDYYVIMPDHVHFILIVEDGNKKTLSSIVGTFKSLTYRELRQQFKRKEKIWQTNYYEHVIRDENTLTKIREYIEYNPEATEIDIKKFYA